MQLPLPLQAPPQPVNVAPPLGTAVSVTGVPLEKFIVHTDGQLIPDGELVTVPLPDTLTLSASPGTAKVAVTFSAALIVTTQLPKPLQAPLQPAKP
jgi:hypothetical protein